MIRGVIKACLLDESSSTFLSVEKSSKPLVGKNPTAARAMRDENGTARHIEGESGNSEKLREHFGTSETYSKVRRQRKKKATTEWLKHKRRSSRASPLKKLQTCSEIKMQMRRPLPPAGLVYGKAGGETVRTPRFAKFLKVFKINPFLFQNDERSHKSVLA